MMAQSVLCAPLASPAHLTLMRHRGSGCTDGGSANSGLASANEEAEGRRPKEPNQQQDSRILLLVGAVALAPVLMAGFINWWMPHVEHGKFWTPYERQRSLGRTEVQKHLMNHTLLHIGGLHRSGTTLLWKGLSLHKDVSKLEFQPGADTRHGHWMDKTYNEGLFLQTVYPKFGLDHRKFLIKKWISIFARRIPFLPEELVSWLRLREGVGRFALDPRHHLNEASFLVHERNQQKLFQEWSLFWDLKRPVLMEKSPSNMVVSPFLHRLWGLDLEKSPARFLFLQRHPLAVAIATSRAGGATVDDLSLVDLVEHWVAAEERRLQDLHQYFAFQDEPGKPSLHKTFTLEQLSKEPKKTLTSIFKWLGLEADDQITTDFSVSVKLNPNEKYFRAYCSLLVKDKHTVHELHEMIHRFDARVAAVSSYKLSEIPNDCKRVFAPDSSSAEATELNVEGPIGYDADDEDDI